MSWDAGVDGLPPVVLPHDHGRQAVRRSLRPGPRRARQR
jgi:hypothetical protein